MRMKMLLAASAVAAITVSAPASAAPGFFTDFDSVNFGANPGYTTPASYEGWTGGQNGLEIQYNNVAGLAYSGANLVELDTNANSSISRLIQAGDYVLSFYYSDRPSVSAASNGIDVLLGNSTLYSVAGGLGGAQTNWTQKTVSFSIDAPTTLSFAATGISDSFGGYLDDIRLQAVPEPGTWAMMIAGFGIIGGAMRRRGARSLATA